ncbi:MAG: response regulator [Cyanophyceae cyanobacterium]
MSLPQFSQLLEANLLANLALLIVDNSSDERELLSMLFQEYGAQTIAVYSASEALAVLEWSRPDVIISELVLKPEDGYSLIADIRSRSTSISRIPILSFTTAAKESDRAAALSAGFDAHLPKPTDIDTIVATVAHLARSQQPIFDCSSNAYN